MTRNESSIIESPREWNKGKECDWKKLAFSNDKERWEPAKDRHELTKGKSYVSTDAVIHDCPRSLLSGEKSARALFRVCTCVCVWMLLLSFALGKVSHGSWFKNSISEDAELFILFTHPACRLQCIPAGVCVWVCMCVSVCVCLLILILALLCSIALSWVIHSLSPFPSSLLLLLLSNHTQRQTDTCIHAPI